MTKLFCIILLLLLLTCTVQSIQVTSRRIRRDEKLTRKPQRESEGRDWIPAPRNHPPAAPWKSIDLSPNTKQSNTNEQSTYSPDSNQLHSRDAIHQLHLSQSQPSDSLNDNTARESFETKLDEDEQEFARELRNKIFKPSPTIPPSNQIEQTQTSDHSSDVIDNAKIPLIDVPPIVTEPVSDDSMMIVDTQTIPSQIADIIPEPIQPVPSIANDVPPVDLPVIEHPPTIDNVNDKSEDITPIDKPIIQSPSQIDSNQMIENSVEETHQVIEETNAKPVLNDPQPDVVKPQDDAKQIESQTEQISEDPSPPSDNTIDHSEPESNDDALNEVQAENIEATTVQNETSSSSVHSIFSLFVLIVVCYVCVTRRHQIKNLLSRASHNAVSRLEEGTTNQYVQSEVKPLMETARDDSFDESETRTESPMMKPIAKPTTTSNSTTTKAVPSRLGAVALVDDSKDTSKKPNKGLDDEDTWNDFDAWDD